MTGLYRLEEFERWQVLIEGLTVEWLLDNIVYRGPSIINNGISTHLEEFSIMWEGQRFSFTSPPHLQCSDTHPFGLSTNQELRLVEYVPMDVMNDFVRVIEL